MTGMRAVGGAIGVIGFAPTAYNSVVKWVNGTINTSDVIDLSISGGLLAAGLLLTNPVGIGLVVGAGLVYGIYRLGWGENNDIWIDENFGFNNKKR
jgi:hypothetical protein